MRAKGMLKHVVAGFALSSSLLVVYGCAEAIDPRTRRIEFEWRIPTSATSQLPSNYGLASGGAIEQGPVMVTPANTKGSYVVIDHSSILGKIGPPRARAFLKFPDAKRPTAVWIVEVPKQGLSQNWSAWKLADFIDPNGRAEFKLINDVADTRESTPKDFVVEMRYRIPSYFE